MDFTKVNPGDLIGLSAKINEMPERWRWVGLWKSRKSFERAEKGHAAAIFGPNEDYKFHPGELILVLKIKHNKTVISYIEGYSLTLRCAVWFPIGMMIDERNFKVVARAKS